MASTKDEEVAKSIVSSGRRMFDRAALRVGGMGSRGKGLGTDALRVSRGRKMMLGGGLAAGAAYEVHKRSSARDGLQGRSSGTM